MCAGPPGNCDHGSPAGVESAPMPRRRLLVGVALAAAALPSAASAGTAVRAPVPAPTGLSARVVATGVRLSWQPLTPTMRARFVIVRGRYARGVTGSRVFVDRRVPC